MVPCDPVSYLNSQYGENWIKPEKRRYNINNINWAKPIEWSDDVIPFVLRYYDEKGKVKINKTLDEINEFIPNKELKLQRLF